jgi:hypothetical protein
MRIVSAPVESWAPGAYTAREDEAVAQAGALFSTERVTRKGYSLGFWSTAVRTPPLPIVQEAPQALVGLIRERHLRRLLGDPR